MNKYTTYNDAIIENNICAILDIRGDAKSCIKIWNWEMFLLFAFYLFQIVQIGHTCMFFEELAESVSMTMIGLV